jgi:hypothetical protein
MDVYIANRTDGVAGSGTQNDPYDGSFRNTTIFSVSSITSSGTTATATTTANHGFQNGQLVLILGATGIDGVSYNGTFAILNVTSTTFQYTMNGPAGSSASGTLTCRANPYLLDAVMRALPATPPVAVHLGPGTFQTGGYADGFVGGFQPLTGMKIVGSGVDVTTLKLAGNAANAHFYAVGHAVASGAQPVTVDYFEISDLTIDCNLADSSGTQVACGAVRALGNHAKVRRIKVKNWGTKFSSPSTSTRPCFVVSALTATNLIWVEDCGIEECIVISPDTGNQGPVTIFHAGAVEAPIYINPQAFGLAPYVRNCFADAGQTNPGNPEIRGISLACAKRASLRAIRSTT